MRYLIALILTFLLAAAVAYAGAFPGSLSSGALSGGVGDALETSPPGSSLVGAFDGTATAVSDGAECLDGDADGNCEIVTTSNTSVRFAPNGTGVMQLVNATPSWDFYDTDATAGDINASINVNCTDTGDGTEDCDLGLSVQSGGSYSEWVNLDTSSGRFQVNRDVWIIDTNFTPTLNLGDATTAGNYGYIEWSSGGDEIRIGTEAGDDALVFHEDGSVQVEPVFTSGTRPTCDATTIGSIVKYDNGSDVISMCACEQTAAATYAWGAMTGAGSC